MEAGDRRKHSLLAGTEMPHNEREHQIILAQEFFTRDFPSEVMQIGDIGFENRMVQYWIDQGCAKAFRDLVTHPDFKQQYRFHGDSLNVTLSDVEYFLHNKELPER